MRYLTAGYSHGNCLIGILSGFCYGMPMDETYIISALEKRRNIMGRGERQELEDDRFEIVSGIYKGKTDGNPIGIVLYNRKKQIEEYNYYTPGYGDLYGAIKYSHTNTFLVKERASARETAVRVSLFSFTKRFLELLDIKIESKVVKCYVEENIKKFPKIVDDFRKNGDSFGGVFEIRVKNTFIGMGDYSDPSQRLESLITKELFTIGSIKSVEFGAKNIEEIKGSKINRDTKLLGGIVCGISDGNDIVIRCKTRAVASIKLPKETIDLKTSKKLFISHPSSDTTSLFACAYISEFVVSYVIANEIMNEFPYRNFDEIKRSVKLWRKKTEKIIKNTRI
jgi:chorismate synthase